MSLPGGPTPIRVNPRQAPEVLWCGRIDPARTVIRSVPLPASGRRFSDLLLHDGAPNGYRSYRKRGSVEVPVFDELQVLDASRYATFEARIAGIAPEALDSLDHALDAADGGCRKIWSQRIQRLCNACSEGRPHAHHAPAPDPTTATGPLRIGIASTNHDTARARLDQWLETTHGAKLLEFARAFPVDSVNRNRQNPLSFDSFIEFS